MPIEVDVPDVGVIEFPDDTTPEVMTRVARTASAQQQLNEARKPSSTYLARVAQQVGEQGEQVFGRISLGGLGRIAGALAKDLVTGNVPAPDPSTGLMTGGMRATAAELLGQETPFDIEESVQGSVVRRGIVGGAKSLPTVGAGMALGGPLGMGVAFGASAAEESGGDPFKTAKGAALGAALPVVGAAARTGTGILAAAAANRGIQAAAVPALQKAAEFVGSQVPVQGIMLADLMASPEYRSASPDEQRDMIAEMSVANLAFALPEVVHAVNPRTQPAAARFESPMVDMARGTAPMNREVQGQPTQPAGPVQRPAPVVMEGQPVIAPPALDTPVLGEARAQVVRQRRPEIQFPDNPVVSPEAPSNVRTDAGGGRVSFAAEAPTLTSNVPDQTADALRREANPVMRPGTTESPPIPEDPAAIAEQVRLTGDPESSKAATLITPGETAPEVPEGLKATETPHGTVIWNPSKTTEADVKKAGEGELFDARLLGQSSGVPVEGRNVVTTSTEAAKNVVTEIVPDGNPEAVKAAVEAQQAAVPGGTTEVKPAIEVAKERVEANQPKKPTVIDVEDLDAVERFLESKIDPKLDEPGAAFTGMNPNIVARAALSFYRAGKSAAQAIDEAVQLAKRSGPVDEPRLRAFLASGLPAQQAQQQRQVTPLPAVPPTGRPLKTVSDAEEVFTPLPKKGTTATEKGRLAVEAIRTGIFSKYRPLSELDEQVRKAAGVAPKTKQQLSAFFETLKGSSGQAEVDVYRFDADMAPHLKGIRPQDFNAFMFANRVVDRLTADPKVKQVDDWTIADAQNVLAELNGRLTPEQRQQIADAGTVFNAHMDAALQRQVDSGRMSAKTYADIKAANSFYAPFKVMRHYVDAEGLPAGASRKIDTQAQLTKAITGIHDPDFRLGDIMTAGRQQIAISRVLAEKNLRMLRIKELADIDTQGQFLKKLAKGQDPARGMGEVVVMEDGEPVHYQVNPRVEKAVTSMGPVTQGILSRMLEMAAKPMRIGATTGNIAFQGVNLLFADQPRLALVSKLGIRNPLDLYRYPVDFIHAAFASALGNRLVPGAPMPKLYQDFLESGAAGATIQKYLTPDALQFNPGAVGKTKSMARTVLETPARIANAVEETTKLMGIKRALRISGSDTGTELARRSPELVTEVRRFAGSPDFGRVGSAVEAARLNLLFMFLNARIQGAAADIGRISGRDGMSTAAATWLKLTTAVGAPALAAWALNQRDEYKADYDRLSENEKRNYFLIPKDDFITNDQGERVRDYWRIPKRETVKLVSNLIEEGLEYGSQRDPEHLKRFAMSVVEDLAPVNIQGRSATERLESVVSSANPLIKAPIELATERNTYLHRDVVPERMQRASPEQQFTDRTQDTFKKLAVWMPDSTPEFMRSPAKLENLAQNLTAGLFTQFMPTRGIEGREGVETWRLLRRFQTTGYIDNPEFKLKLEKLQREQADESLDRERTAEKIVKDSKGDSRAAIQAAVREFRTARDKAGVERVIEMLRMNKAGVTSEDKRLLQLAPKQRAEFMAEQISGMQRQDALQYMRTMRERKVMSDQTVLELRKLQALGARQPAPAAR